MSDVVRDRHLLQVNSTRVFDEDPASPMLGGVVLEEDVLELEDTADVDGAGVLGSSSCDPQAPCGQACKCGDVEDAVDAGGVAVVFAGPWPTSVTSAWRTSRSPFAALPSFLPRTVKWNEPVGSLIR